MKIVFLHILRPPVTNSARWNARHDFSLAIDFADLFTLSPNCISSMAPDKLSRDPLCPCRSNREAASPQPFPVWKPIPQSTRMHLQITLTLSE